MWSQANPRREKSLEESGRTQFGGVQTAIEQTLELAGRRIHHACFEHLNCIFESFGKMCMILTSIGWVRTVAPEAARKEENRWV